jgi:hypothetical protein
LSSLGLLGSGAVLRLSVVFTDTYDTCILQVWYISIGMHFILLHVEFEDGLSLSGLKYRATCPKNFATKNRKGSQKRSVGV